MALLRDDSRCPCMSGASYRDCCGRLHRGDLASATTAEQLMRSRYSAFVAQDESYLLATWHPRRRPTRVEFDDGLQWVGLEIISAERGGVLDSDGTVEFRATYREAQERGELHESSRFVRVDGMWCYLDGEVVPKG